MSKQPPSYDLDNDPSDPPPSYTFTLTSPSASSFSQQLPQTLSSLTSLLRTTQAQQSALASHKTITLLPLLTPHLTALLTTLATSPSPPPLAELVFVPAAAVDPRWSIASETNEVVQVIRVSPADVKESPSKSGQTPTTGPSSSSSSLREPSSSSSLRPNPPAAFDEWGRWSDSSSSPETSREEEWWWADEDMARRLARQLQPEPRLDRTVVRQVVEQVIQEKKKARGWGLFRGGSSSEAVASSSSSSAPPPDVSMARQQQQQDEDVSMTVRSEEVTFRRENELGIWESMRGWGIVARVRIRR
ncbi:hypothetical protein CGGC5_v009012 [Colletotrichum fructicola Nara gc5]|uniref:Nad dependent epimerase dehydratase family protein n=1 Tax=Colletotrichum fructicola (strain Nara gc5) TaxID=1213859 RepID=A0A7J6J1C9_COLFN|nr:hypothetical protein CGGC5_v009012 [Colletotrichum fructicola Nara gc5]